VRPNLPAICLLLFAAACTVSTVIEDQSGWTGTVVEEAGTTTVRTLNGSVWGRDAELVEEPAIDQPEGTIHYRIVSPEGEFLGVTRLPARSRRGMTRLSKGCLIVVERDPETRERTIAVYRIRPVAPGLPEQLRTLDSRFDLLKQ
jgi:hypothetical protein